MWCCMRVQLTSHRCLCYHLLPSSTSVTIAPSSNNPCSHLWQQSRLTSEDQARFWAQLQRHVASLADQSSVPTSHVRVPRWAVVALLRMAHWHIAESGGQALRGGVG